MRIVCAANRFGNSIILGARHWDHLMHQTYDFRYDGIAPHSRWEQGFIDSQGNFLTREEAWDVAVEYDQIFRLVGNQTDTAKGQKLYSENLY